MGIIGNYKKSKYLQLFANKIEQKTLQIRLLYRSNQIQKIIFTFYRIPKRPILEIRSNKNYNIQSIRKIIKINITIWYVL